MAPKRTNDDDLVNGKWGILSEFRKLEPSNEVGGLKGGSRNCIGNFGLRSFQRTCHIVDTLRQEQQINKTVRESRDTR